MVFRFLLRYLANNEQLIQRMAESYPMRRAAQMVVSIMYRSKNMAQERGIHDMTPERFKSFISFFKDNIKKEIEGVKDQMKKKPF
ncbi:protein NCBP2AS2 homolog [Anastrepha obliqua]|uniref:protein NCBP2AS2 homolog n=1 Tax=Anastrepha ludens TaxID=28586 RepID=UPI0023B19BE4|nr:protein NCBP2AS2 homolog [Anastrepha ludens]XP_054737304.1 protein NCBP2AS2 homolog [Anastrepha obliqua]